MRPRTTLDDLDDAQHLLTTGEAAAALGCHPDTIRRWRDLPVVRVSNRHDRRYRVADVLNAWAQRAPAEEDLELGELWHALTSAEQLAIANLEPTPWSGCAEIRAIMARAVRDGGSG